MADRHKNRFQICRAPARRPVCSKSKSSSLRNAAKIRQQSSQRSWSIFAEASRNPAVADLVRDV
jgi:hypothetical protein